MENEEILKTKAGDFIGNQAVTSEALVDPCSNCDETIHFALQDKNHTFSIGLITVLECLSFAEEQGEVPKLPSDWWISIVNRYRINR